LLVSNGLCHLRTPALATVSNASMQGVGTKMGTVERIQPRVLSRCLP